jgi:hypothetical protein
MHGKRRRRQLAAQACRVELELRHIRRDPLAVPAHAREITLDAM